MKKYLIIILCLFSWLNPSSASNVVDDEKEKIDLSVKNKKNSNTNQRSILLIEAYFLTGKHIVEVSIDVHNLTEFFILDSNNVLIDYKRISPDNNSIINLSTNGPGDYLLIIESDDFYAEGMFTI